MGHYLDDMLNIVDTVLSFNNILLAKDAFI